MTTPVSETIYASRDAIRTQVIDFLQQYMELNEVDLTQSSFLSYIIDILTTLSSNLMFYQSNIYREFFLTQAQLPESVHNLSSFLGYSPKEAKYATADLLVKIWLPFNDPNTQITIPKNFEFKTGDGTTFVTYYITSLKIAGNSAVNATIENDGKIYNLKTTINLTTEPFYFQFVLPVRQYKTTRQETQIEDDLQPYQFTNKNISISGKVANITVYVKKEDDNSVNGTLFTKFNSLYLMSSSDAGYVLRVSPEGRRIYFGNGIIGQQPSKGATVIIYIDETLGSAGNVIAGSIISGQRIYSIQNGLTTLVDYEVINPSPAFGGEDEEDLQQIRSNSIKSLVSLGRLVSEQDYKNFDVVIPNAPVKSNSIPVLKRSDLKINEIQLYTIFEFGDELVPTKNVSYTIESGSTLLIPRHTIINIGGTEYITIFELELDSMNESAYYSYSMRQIDLIPTLIETWTLNGSNLYHFNITGLEVISNFDLSATFTITYYSTEDDFNLCQCKLKVVSSDEEYDMINTVDPPDSQGNVTSGKFTYIFDDYKKIPFGVQLFYFTVSNWYIPPSTIINPDEPHDIIPNPFPNERYENSNLYSASLVYRQNLKSYMLSNTLVGVNNTTIYDIPVIKKSYYDSINQKDFELQVLQKFLTTADLKSYRMLTDFINIKLCNTTGFSSNMLKNSPTRESVIDKDLVAIPTTPMVNDSYIITGNEVGEWYGKRDQIAVCSSIEPTVWTFIQPKANDIVRIVNKGGTIFIFTEFGWINPVYNIPLRISIELFKEKNTSVGDSDLINSIKTSIYNYYKDDFGPSLIVRRSKLIDIIHNTAGVSHCRLLQPESDIFFDFNIDNFNQQELLEYSPEWIYFTEDDIIIKIFTLD